MKIECQRQGDDPHEPAVGFLHLLELTTPDCPVGDLEQVLGFRPGFVDGAAQVAAADAELEGDHALAVLTVDGRGAGVDERAVGLRVEVLVHWRDQVAEPQSRRAADRVGRVGQAAADRGRGQGMPAALGVKPEPCASTTWLLMMSTGMSRIDVSSLRRHLGQRIAMSNRFSPSTMVDCG